MQRLRLYDCRNSRLPSVVGACVDDIRKIANYVNTAQRRLLMAKESGDEGWYGTWAEIRFNLSRATPFITLPREVARLMGVNVCDRPVPVQNQIFEYLQFGNGRFPKHFQSCGWNRQWQQGYERNNVPTFYDLATTPQWITCFPTNTQDIGKRVLLQGYDANNAKVYSQDDSGVRIDGIFVTLTTPFVTSPFTFSRITGLQKDVTMGPVQFEQMDPTTSASSPLSTMDPGEQSASYRRYYFNDLPCNCCQSPTFPDMVQTTAIVKLDLVPVVADTDYCLIQSLEAIIEECQSIRYSEMDIVNAKTMAGERHIQAIRLLLGELALYHGRDNPAVQSWPYGSARLEKQRIGSLI